MQRNRDKIDIYNLMLEAAKDGAIKRAIANKAEIGWTTLNSYLKYLESLDLIEKTDKKTYKTMEKGLEFMARYEGLVGLINKD